MELQEHSVVGRKFVNTAELGSSEHVVNRIQDERLSGIGRSGDDIQSIREIDDGWGLSGRVNG